ncbi:hypothetical protein BDP27DRAFT_802938 [Rhodocollybia butyracea]|uniref:Uncharacterized protein n=1 Tax=Rhodocollybia butyracea TaxID=206335 RepID=A0A9P5Q831_9AGAR|nr:hypothetical protein BDP27DRAFT_802938 [Rhodocollybia butyracea]
MVLTEKFVWNLFQTRTLWEIIMMRGLSTGSLKKRFAAVQSGADSKSKNQCVFLRGLKVTLRKRSLDRKTTVKVSVIPGAGLDVDKELRSKGKGTSTSWGKSLFSRTSSDSTQGLEDASSSPSSPQRGSPGSKSTEEDESTDSDDSFYFWAEPYHPSDILNRWILNEYPDVDIAFTHDNDWIWAICEVSYKLEFGQHCDADILFMRGKRCQMTQSLFLASAAISLLRERVDPMVAFDAVPLRHRTTLSKCSLIYYWCYLYFLTA